MPDYKFETEYHDKGYEIICGVDEAGRGPLCGDVFAAAVVLPINADIPELNDSKKLSEKKRELLYDKILNTAITYGIASASPEEIDELNILNATMLAMRRAISKLQVQADFALVDGNCTRGFDIPAVSIVSGDALCCSISAASILAKVSRDRQCREYEEMYPGYGFAKHKGYGTKAHMDALRTLGPCPIHRKTFLKFLNNDQ